MPFANQPQPSKPAAPNPQVPSKPKTKPLKPSVQKPSKPQTNPYKAAVPQAPAPKKVQQEATPIPSASPSQAKKLQQEATPIPSASPQSERASGKHRSDSAKSKTLKLTSWEKESLDRHNLYRNQIVTKDGKPLDPFTWRKDLAEKAQIWANKLVEKSKNEGDGIDLVHSSEMNWGTGENLFSMLNGDMGAGVAVDAWFNEWPLYNNEPIGEGNFGGYGHYTQLAWPETKFLGCAYGDNGDSIRFTVCQYHPPGNFVGERLNVFVKGKQTYKR